MAKTLLGADNTGDSGAAFKIVVRICGLVAIVCIFLPFLFKWSILDLIKVLTETGSGSFVENFKALIAGSTTMGSVTNVLILFAYVAFPIFGISMAIRGKYAGGPFTFLLLFNLAAFLLGNFFGAEAGFEGNFFVNTSLGYWVGCGALLTPFIAMFFLDKSI